jgi:hypothetical protein
VFGCATPTVWHAELPSPDGKWIAIAETQQNGGFGTASISTTVSLKPTHLSNAPMDVLGFSCEDPVPRAYTLDNTANVGGTIDLKMQWITPTHLDVTYRGHPDVYLQTVKLWGADISLRNLSSDNSVTPATLAPPKPH